MGLGILEPRAPGHNNVPGTSLVLDHSDRPDTPSHFHTNIKYDRKGPVPIILVPQPSEDPNDPLVQASISLLLAAMEANTWQNWPLVR
ncbi:MAG: hypothetical protein Q9174_000363 [Haloplaca sp. 1 TL-2023]